MEVERFAVAAETERHPAAGIVRIAERLFFAQHQIPVASDNRAGGDFVPGQIVRIVADEPAAYVDGLVGRVVQLDPVRRPAGGIRQNLVDDHRAQLGDHTRVVEAGRAPNLGAGPPGAFLAKRIRIRHGGGLDRQREALPIGDVVPAVAVLEALDDLAGGILQIDPLARVVKTAGVLSGNGKLGAVGRLEGREVSDHQDMPARFQFDAGERELDPPGELHEVQIDRFVANVGQLHVLGVRVGRVVHDLADPK